MAPRLFSRHTFSSGIKDEDDNLILEDPKVFEYRELPDNQLHLVQQGDTLAGLAGRYFSELPRAAGFFWVIAWFQPDPIHDPTIALAPGSKLVIPSVSTLRRMIFGAERYDEE